jgi:para-nitrobenzyl esterase
MARAMSRTGEPAYLYRFTWSDAGKRAKLGACHGEELYFLSNSFPPDWTAVDGEKRFGEILRQSWTNFAKSGQPDGPALPIWPAYDSDSNRILELGRHIELKPFDSGLFALQRLMQPILEKIGK